MLGYQPRADSADEDLVDPRDRRPAFWFEQMARAAPGRWRRDPCRQVGADDQAEARVASVFAAGGRMVRDKFAPTWWTLADSAGNEADIATTMERDWPQRGNLGRDIRPRW